MGKAEPINVVRKLNVMYIPHYSNRDRSKGNEDN